MIDFKNKQFRGSANRSSLFDCCIPKDARAVIIFIHGYKGFKDWGAWSLMGDAFVQNDFGFVKFNMSHNGGTVEEPIDFPDLTAFGENRYSYELYDLEQIIDEVERMISYELELTIPIYLLGHSRGGGMAILKASTDARIKKVISLAGISEIASRFPKDDELEEWKIDGVRHVLNGRTGQEMPHYYSFYEDFIENSEQLDIEDACYNLNVPFLQIHGDMDQAVSISEGLRIASWTESKIAIVKGAEHTFGSLHPWKSEQLPEELREATELAIKFFKE